MTSDHVHRYLLAYDITDDLRRTRVAKILESFGDRIQYSVFLIDTKPAKMVRLRFVVTATINLTIDSLLICDLGPLTDSGTRRIQFIGSTRSTTSHGPLVM